MEDRNPFTGIRSCGSWPQLLLVFLSSTLAAVLLSLLSIQVLNKVFFVPVGTFEVTTFIQGVCCMAVCTALLVRWGAEPLAVLRDWRRHLAGDALDALKYFGVYVLMMAGLIGAAMLLLRSHPAGTMAAFSRVAPDRSQYAETARVMASSAPRFSLLSAAILALAPLSEELFFRRFLYVFLRQRLRFAWALLASSVLFSAVHLSAAPFVFPVALLLGWAYEKRRRLPVNIMLHALINLTVLFVQLG
jgi:membrane protease YdiL (CAAX protease family)